MPLRLLAFDADDTLWHNEYLYRRGRAQVAHILARYGVAGADGFVTEGVLDSLLDQIEVNNLGYFGYGIMSFMLSMVEAGVTLTGGRLTGEDAGRILQIGKEMLDAPVDLLPGVAETLERLAGQIPMAVITKGELHQQLKKVERSGLSRFFKYTRVVDDKTPEVYAGLLREWDVAPGDFMMVGNSLKSDILPVVRIGGHAVYIHNEMTWAHERIPHTDDDYYEVHEIGKVLGLVGGERKESWE